MYKEQGGNLLLIRQSEFYFGERQNFCSTINFKPEAPGALSSLFQDNLSRN
jgi:hypothetical protein